MLMSSSLTGAKPLIRLAISFCCPNFISVASVVHSGTGFLLFIRLLPVCAV